MGWFSFKQLHMKKNADAFKCWVDVYISLGSANKTPASYFPCLWNIHHFILHYVIPTQLLIGILHICFSLLHFPTLDFVHIYSLYWFQVDSILVLVWYGPLYPLKLLFLLFFKEKINYLFSFYIPTPVPTPFLSPVSSTYLPTPLPIHSS